MINMYLSQLLDLPYLAYNRIKNNIIKMEFAECGKNVNCSYNFTVTNPSNIYVGNNIYIGPSSFFMSRRAKIIIGDDSMFGPNVMIITGSHRTDLIGRYMISVGNDEKLPENDQDVIISGDNWICANVTILQGVTIGRGAIVSAGAVVTKDVKPYSIVGRVPARLIKMRFCEVDLKNHINELNKNPIEYARY